MASIELAYNTSSTIPSVGSTRQTLTVTIANDRLFDEVSVDHDLLDHSIKTDVIGIRRRVHIIFGVGALQNSSTLSFLQSFFASPWKWAKAGAFTDSGESTGLCRCKPANKSVDLTILGDLQNGMDLVSEKVY